MANSITSVRSGRATKLSSYITPMLATLHSEPFDDSDWLFEMKWDGYRAIAECGETTRLYSRNGLSFAVLYKPIFDACKIIKKKLILDGEIVVLDDEGKASFQLLQQYGSTRRGTLVYFVFDCLFANGKSMTDLPLLERKKIIEKILPANNVLRVSPFIVSEGKALFREIQEKDLEGIIAKRVTSKYTAGKRSKDWLKIKNHAIQEAIIIGFTAPRGSREFFGSLLLGIYQQKELKYIGHTGTGFTGETLRKLHEKLNPLIQARSPLHTKVPAEGRITWVAPKLVCIVKYTEITADGKLRHPVFQGLRVDKTAEEVDRWDR